MTVEDLLLRRDAILRTIGKAREQFGERSVQYSDAASALALIDLEISKVNSTSSTQGSTSLAQFSKE